jgi:hypothetical protein
MNSKSILSIFSWLALFVVLAVSILHFQTMSKQSLTGDGYLSCDEGFTFSAADSIRTDGYFGFRCRDLIIGACYGGTQSFIDAALLKLIPDSLTERHQLVSMPGKPWPWLSRNSWELDFLRYSRVLFAFLLIMVCFFVFEGSKVFRATLALMVSSSWAFMNAWSGMKNDYPNMIIFVIYLFLAKRLAAIQELKVYDKYLFGGFLLGTLGIWIRPVLLVPVFLGTGIFFLLRWIRWKKFLSSFVLAFGYLGVFGFLFVLLHPNIWAGTLELRWLDPLIYTANPNFTREHVLLESKLLFYGIWPLAFYLLALVFGNSGFLKEKFFEKEFLPLLILIVMGVLTVKGFQGKAYYYLPLIFLSLYLFSLVAESSKMIRELFLVFGAIITIYGSVLDHRAYARPFPYATGVSLNQEWEVKLRIDIYEAIKSGKSVWIDRNLRPSLELAEIDSNKIIFFDSLVSNPAKISALINKESAQVFSTCWEKSQDTLKIEVPAAQDWFSLTKEFCGEAEPLVNRAVFPHSQFFKAHRYFSVSAQSLLNFEKGTGAIPKLIGSSIHPRILTGSENGRDYLEEFFQWLDPGKLSGDFVASNEADKVNLVIASECKENQDLVLSVKIKNRISTSRISLNIQDKFCQDYPKLCKYKRFQNWSNRRYPLSLELSNIDLRVGDAFQVQLESSGNCSVYLKPIQFYRN